MTLQNKRIDVTGASRGIGGDICGLLATSGAEIIAGARNFEHGAKLSESIQRAALELADQESINIFAANTLAGCHYVRWK